MAIVKMEKLRLYVHKSVGTPVFRAIQKLGIVEFTEIKNKESLKREEKTVFEFNYANSRLDFAIEFLTQWEDCGKRVERIKRSLEGDKIFITGEKIDEIANTFYWNDVVDSAQDLEEKMNDTDTKLKELNSEMLILEKWKELDMALSTPLETKTTKTVFLIGQKEEAEKLLNTLKSTKILHNLQIINQEHFILTFFKKNTDISIKKISENKLEIIELPKRRGTPIEEIERLGRAIVKNQKLERELRKQAQTLAKNLPKLKIVGDHIFWKKEKHNLLSSAYKKNDVLIFEGWCPKTHIAILKKKIGEKTKLFAMENILPEKNENPPVEIKNNKIIKPFEAITRLYGLPGNKDLDPTPFLAGFFFIFFGLSLTDVGYGLFLFIITATLLIFFRIPKDTKPLISLLMLGGISSFLIGMLFGGYLGVDMQYLPQWAQKIQMFDPIANPLPVFYLALTFGVIQIVFGLILKIIRDAKIGMMKDGLLDQGPWIALIFSLILFGANKIGFNLISSSLSIWFIYGSLLSLVLTQGRKENTVIKKFFMGVLSIYNSINFFSDILSYSRLLALGLATSALAFAVNLIAGMASDVPYIGGILVVIILVVGHLFNLAVNLLGAFIHSARLQFVEFFGKFITDGGRSFNPFKREERYVVIKPTAQ